MVILAAFLLITGLLLFVHYTKSGRAMRAIEQDPEQPN